MIRFVVYIALFAAVVYAFFWLLERRNGAGGSSSGGRGPGGRGPGGGPGGGTPRGPKGPDDDEDFLRELDRKRRRRHAEPPEDA